MSKVMVFAVIENALGNIYNHGAFHDMKIANEVALERHKALFGNENMNYDYEDEKWGCFYSWEETCDITVMPMELK